MSVDTYFRESKYSHVKAVTLLRIGTERPGTQHLEARRLRPMLPDLWRCYDIPNGHLAVKYIILCYDRKSPFRALSPLVAERKKEVLRALGIDAETPLAKALATLSPPSESDGDYSMAATICDGLSNYLRFQDDRLWSLIVLNENNFEQYLLEANKPISSYKGDKERLQAGEVKGKLMLAAEECHLRLKQYWSEFTGKDPDAEIAVRERRAMTPESVAMLMEEEE